MLIARAALLFVAAFLCVSALAQVLPGLPRLAATAWGAVSHAQGVGWTDDGTPALALYADRYGHFVADAEIGGTQLELMIDSGASYVGLTGEDAARLGIDPGPEDFTLKVGTANGSLRLAPVVIPELTIGHLTLRDVPATVSPHGALHSSLLGMTALSRFSRVEFSSSRMLLVP